MKSRVVIVGGGLSGLALAYRLRQRQPGLEITLLEKQASVGGNIGTIEREGFRIERGPNGIFDAKPHTLQLCRDLSLGDQLITGSESARQNRFLVVNSRLRKLPGSLASFIGSSSMSWRSKVNLLMERFRRRPLNLPDDESVADFARRRVGTELTETLVDAFVTGIHAGDPERLSVSAAFPRLLEFEKVYGSITRGFSAARKLRRREAAARGEQPQPQRLWSFRPGLQVLVDALRRQLTTAPVNGVSVRKLERIGPSWRVWGDGRDCWDADAVVLTAHAPEQAAMLADIDSTLAGEIDAIPYCPIAVVAIGYRKADLPSRCPDGFGYLVPWRERRNVLGVQWCSSIYPDRAPNGSVLWRALCGGSRSPEMFDWPDDRLVQTVRDELRLTMGVTTAPAMVEIVRWPRAIPQYVVGHVDRVRRIETCASRLPGLFLGGNAYHGVAMNDCTELANVLAQQIESYLAGG